MLSPSLAQEIARDTTDIIGYNVVITDRDGVVIGSGDRARVGSFHEASVDVMRTVTPATHSAEQAHLLEGVRPGITLPLVLDHEVVGSVGLTGAPSRVRRFGLVVRNQTELLLRESSLITSRLVRENAVTDLLRDVAHHDPDIVEAAVVELAGRELGYDLRLPRVAVALDTEGVPAARAGGLLRTARQVFSDPQDVVGILGRAHLIVLHRLPGRSSATGADELPAVCLRLVAALRDQHGLDLRVGVGDPAAGVAGLRDSHADARSAIRLAAQRPGDTGPIVRIADFRLHELLAAVGVRSRERFARSVLGPLREHPDADTLRRTVIAWCEQGFHLVRAARVLHVHRNTLIYRLRKIEQITGRDPREHRYALALHMACLIDEVVPAG